MEDKLQAAPLIETIFELRWKPEIGDSNQGFPSRHHSYDLSSFPFDLAGEIRKAEYEVSEHLVPEFVPPTEHQIRTRYRRQQGSYPCLQTGDGIFTVNQINDGYHWSTFKSDILHALDLFFKARHSDYPIRFPELSLRYIDGIQTDGFSRFLAENTRIEARVSSEMQQSLGGMGRLRCRSVAYEGDLSEPEGAHVSIAVEPSTINDQPGALLRYLVSGKPGNEVGSITINAIDKWLESAHKVLHQIFVETFTEEAFRRFQ